MKTWRNSWCQRTLQYSFTEVDSQGRCETGGQFEAGWRNRTLPTNVAKRYSISTNEHVHTPPQMPAKAANALRGKKLRFGSKNDPPPVGLLIVGQTRCIRYCAVSYTVTWRRKAAITEGIDSGAVLRRGVDFGDHDHPIPRRLKKRSNASRLTREMEERFLKALASSWSTVGLCLLIGSLIMKVHSNDLSTITDTPIYVNISVNVLTLMLW
jgi:hypothetical protein